MKLLPIKVDDYGGAPVATHNMPCNVCRDKHAVINLSTGVFEPCWSCQSSGWVCVKFPMWLYKLYKKFFR